MDNQLLPRNDVQRLLYQIALGFTERLPNEDSGAIHWRARIV